MGGAVTSSLALESTEGDVKWASMKLDALAKPALVAAKVAELVQAGALTSGALRRVNPPNKAKAAVRPTMELRKWLNLRSVLLSAQEPTAEACEQLQRRLRAFLDQELQLVAGVLGKDTAAFNRSLAQRQVVLERIFQARRRAHGLGAGSEARAATGSAVTFATGGLDVGVERMMALSIQLQLLNMGANPDLIAAAARHVADSVLALRAATSARMPRAVADCTHALTNWFADRVAQGAALPAEGASACVDAMVRLCVASGSLRAVLDTAAVLLGAVPGVDTAALSVATDTVRGALEQLAALNGDFRLSAPTTLARSDALSSTVVNAACQRSAVAADGTYLYIYNGLQLVKVGTGHGSIAGRVYARNQDVPSNETAGLACVGDRLFFRAASVAPAAIQTFDTTSLAVVESAPDAALPAPAADAPPAFFTEGRFLYCATQDADGGAALLVADPHVVKGGKLAVVKTVPLSTRAQALLFAGGDACSHMYTNGQRLVVFGQQTAHVVHLETGEVAEVEGPLACVALVPTCGVLGLVRAS